MKWFYNLKISVELVVTFIIVAMISGVVGVIGISNITKINNNDTILYENMTVPLSEVANMARLYQRARVNSRNMILDDDPSEIQESYNKINQFLSQIDEYAVSFEKTIVQDEVRQYFEQYKQAINKYRTCIDELYELCIENRDEEALVITKGDLQDIEDEVRLTVDKLLELKVNGAQNQSESNDAAANTAIVTMITVIIIAVFVAVSLGIFVSRIISNPRKKLVVAADRISDGDLDVHIDINIKEEMGNLT